MIKAKVATTIGENEEKWKDRIRIKESSMWPFDDIYYIHIRGLNSTVRINQLIKIPHDANF